MAERKLCSHAFPTDVFNELRHALKIDRPLQVLHDDHHWHDDNDDDGDDVDDDDEVPLKIMNLVPDDYHHWWCDDLISTCDIRDHDDDVYGNADNDGDYDSNDSGGENCENYDDNSDDGGGENC